MTGNLSCCSNSAARAPPVENRRESAYLGHCRKWKISHMNLTLTVMISSASRARDMSGVRPALTDQPVRSNSFSRDHMVVAPNLRGFPPSDQPEAVEAYAMPRSLGDVHALLRSLGRERCILVVNGWGGYIARVLASAYR